MDMSQEKTLKARHLNELKTWTPIQSCDTGQEMRYFEAFSWP